MPDFLVKLVPTKLLQSAVRSEQPALKCDPDKPAMAMALSRVYISSHLFSAPHMLARSAEKAAEATTARARIIEGLSVNSTFLQLQSNVLHFQSSSVKGHAQNLNQA